MNGPRIPWVGGRVDRDAAKVVATRDVPPNGRLPDASKGADHLRAIFGRMGFTDQEIVALSGAHALGRCHVTRSGYDGPWTYTPTRFSNQYFVLLTKLQWAPRTWEGPLQYENVPDGDLMMLPTDMVLVQDAAFCPWVEVYAADKGRFFHDFAAAFSKLLHLGFKPARI